MHCRTKLLLGIFLALFAAVHAEATPFELIVPSSITFSTWGGVGLSGEVFVTWLVATSDPIDFPRSTNNSPAPYTLGMFSSDNPDITPSSFRLSSWSNSQCQNSVGSDCTGLIPGQVVAFRTTSGAGQAGIELLTEQVLPAEEIISTQLAGLQFSSQIFWERHYTGSATLDFTFAIGQDVARYSMLATFVDSPGDPSFTITSAQRVASVFDPSLPPPPLPVPEPSSVVLLGFGLSVIVYMKVKRGIRPPFRKKHSRLV